MRYTAADVIREKNAEIRALRKALAPFAAIPLEMFGWEDQPKRPIHAFNNYTLYVNDVLAARAALPRQRSWTKVYGKYDKYHPYHYRRREDLK